MHGSNPRTGTKSRPFLLLLVPFLALVLSGCGGSNAATEDRALDYVALGDSFTATGLPEMETDGCGRSSQNYPRLVAEQRDDVRVVDVSCGGASTAEMTGPQEAGGTLHPPQLDVVDEDTDLVTLGIGGNDFDIYWTFMYRCVEAAAEDPDGAPCREQNGRRLEPRFARITANIVEVVQEIRDRAPEARVLLVGYPRLLPDNGSCPDRLPLATDDVDYVREMTARLVKSVSDAADEADVEYLDLWTPSEGHDICSDEPWVNDVTDGPEGAFNLHPFPAHQAAVAGLILDIL